MDAAIADRSAASIAGATPDEIRSRFTASRLEAIDMLCGADADRRISTPLGPFRIADYLRTRTLEVVAHGIDIARAIGVTPWEPPANALADSIALLGELAVIRGDGPALLMAMTGSDPAAHAPFPVIR